MSKNVLKARAKFRKEENAKKKARKKIIIVGICLVLILGGFGIFLFVNTKQKREEANSPEFYSYGSQSVQLLADGKFTASLAHNVSKSGTFTKANENERIAVSFYIDGRTEIGYIYNNSLHLPREWDDGHGHGSIFPKVEKFPSTK